MKTFQPKYKLTKRTYATLIGLVFLFFISAFYPFILPFTELALVLAASLLVLDLLLFIRLKEPISMERFVSERFSNGDQNLVTIRVDSKFRQPTNLVLIDEIPIQFQKRDFQIKKALQAGETAEFSYWLRPVRRGYFHFGDLHCWVTSRIGFIKRHYRQPQHQKVAVYPSFHRLANIELLSFAEMKNQMGLKRIRQLGYNREFEQVKDYSPGDEIRHINWRATARKNRLMVNQFQDEKSQSVYCVIDMGRTMEMPFEGMSLLDYAINASLALSQIVMKNDDKAGLITYNSSVHSLLPAEKSNQRMNQLMELLFAQTTNFGESYLDPVYTAIRRKINQRSLLIFFINFESVHSIRRLLPLFIRLSKLHLVLLVNFLNTEIEAIATDEADNLEGVYRKVVANEMLNEKRIFLNELSKYGIYTLYEPPQHIGIQTINKYLAIKSRGLI